MIRTFETTVTVAGGVGPFKFTVTGAPVAGKVLEVTATRTGGDANVGKAALYCSLTSNVAAFILSFDIPVMPNPNPALPDAAYSTSVTPAPPASLGQLLASPGHGYSMRSGDAGMVLDGDIAGGTVDTDVLLRIVIEELPGTYVIVP